MCCSASDKIGIQSTEKLQKVSIKDIAPVTEEIIRRTCAVIADDIETLAKELRKSKTPAERREVLQALLWHAESVRRLLEAEQRAVLRRAANE